MNIHNNINYFIAKTDNLFTWTPKQKITAITSVIIAIAAICFLCYRCFKMKPKEIHYSFGTFYPGKNELVPNKNIMTTFPSKKEFYEEVVKHFLNSYVSYFYGMGNTVLSYNHNGLIGSISDDIYGSNTAECEKITKNCKQISLPLGVA